MGCKDHDTEHTYRIFVTTFLGYGANEALARHRRDLVLSQVEKGVRYVLAFIGVNTWHFPRMIAYKKTFFSSNLLLAV